MYIYIYIYIYSAEIMELVHKKMITLFFIKPLIR